MKNEKRKKGNIGGQSLIEILVALGIGVILIGGVAALIAVNARRSAESKMIQVAASLARETIESAESGMQSDWSGFYALPKGDTNKFHIDAATNGIATGVEMLTVDGYDFLRYFYVENVNRTRCGVGSSTVSVATPSCESGFFSSEIDVAEDPLTQKVTAVVGWAGGRSTAQKRYVSRAKNAVVRQTDWSGGGGDNSILLSPNNKYAAASGIDVTTPGSLKVILTGGAGFDSGWLTSPIFDLGENSTLNTVIWKGVNNNGYVRFQIAASAAPAGPWNDADYKGPDGTSGTSYPAMPNESTVVRPRDFSGVRYVRYKVIIESNIGRTESPDVQDFVLTYSL